jgi:hypothetical protein
LIRREMKETDSLKTIDDSKQISVRNIRFVLKIRGCPCGKFAPKMIFCDQYSGRQKYDAKTKCLSLKSINSELKCEHAVAKWTAQSASSEFFRSWRISGPYRASHFQSLIPRLLHGLLSFADNSNASRQVISAWYPN